jgi:transposase-like protein
MPWKQEKGLEEQRERFVREALVKEKTFGQLCREYQISRKTGYKWCGRASKHLPTDPLEADDEDENDVPHKWRPRRDVHAPEVHCTG